MKDEFEDSVKERIPVDGGRKDEDYEREKIERCWKTYVERSVSQDKRKEKSVHKRTSLSLISFPFFLSFHLSASVGDERGVEETDRALFFRRVEIDALTSSRRRSHDEHLTVCR